MPNNELFAKPVLSLVIAEDEESWSERLRILAEHLRQWPMSRTGQVELEVHTCRSVEAFKKTVRTTLDAGALVYATIDLGMPLLESDERFSEQAGRDMVIWCLEQRNKGEHLEFCLVSAREAFVDTLYRKSPELESQRVKRIYKSEIEGWPAAQARLLDMVNDIQGFVRRHMSFCTVKLHGTGDTIPIWFGSDESMLRLLGRADRIASSEEAGVYILSSDAGGYEIDWARLCCELRGVRLNDLDIRVTNPELQPDWRNFFDDPPEALLVRNLDYARNQGCDIAPLLDSGFFEKLERRRCLVFFQFPRFDTQLNVLDRLDEDVELPILTACLRYIYKEDVHVHQGAFDFGDNNRIVVFPPYKHLKSAGVVRKAIQFQVAESGRQMGCEIDIEPELFEVLAEIPWDQKGGLQQLRGSIRSAFRSHAAGRGGSEPLTEECFKGDRVVPLEFRGELGFLVRGRRLYELLENRHTSRGAERWGVAGDPEQALENLEILWNLYDGLDRLRGLGEDLDSQPSSPAFTEEDYKVLHEAWSFLDKLFENPVALRKRIEKFHSHMASPAWRSYYPTLETKKSKAAVENIRFSWPFTRLPLHPAVATYLLMNRVRALIHREIDDYLKRYTDLAGEWEHTEQTRDRLFEAIMQREEEREVAESYAREHHSQPVLVHLVPHMNQEERRSPFAKILSSFLTFNCFLALAENHYVFGSMMIDNKDILRRVLSDRVELGPMVGFLSDYTRKLRSSNRADESIFHRWRDDWALASQQQDAIRLTKQIAGSILDSKYRDSVSREDRSVFQDMADLEGAGTPCKLGAILNFFLIIRNSFYKNAGGDFEIDHGRELRDLMRRLVVATTAACRLGRVNAEGTSVELWSKERFENAELAPLVVGGNRWPGLLVIARGGAAKKEEVEAYESLFPIHDLIQVRPDQGSVWAYYKKKSVWTNLTHVEGSDEEPSLSAEDRVWLPSKAELVSSELWRSIYDG